METKNFLSLNPDNPHYLTFRGKPTLLITSGEHYGAVMNLDFDYVKYLDELQACGLNLTRMFSGIYVESDKSFNIHKNTLAPASMRFICPWARSDVSGYANGGNKFDLTKWDTEYFKRLKDFISNANKRSIAVEVVLFCPYYGDDQWNLSPINVNNNVNNMGDLPRTDALTMKNADMVAVHDAMVRKVVSELKEFDNIYYEICNEPYFGGVTIEWQNHIASVISDVEKNFPQKHLIAQNIANKSAKIENPNPLVSIFNFHYAVPPDAVGVNYGLNKVIGDDETGFRGTANFLYRTEAWEFIIAGGAIYSNLDYSFTAGNEDGTFEYPATQPGGGNRTFRNQIKILKDFIHGFEFTKMSPSDSVIKRIEPSYVKGRVLAEIGNAYAIYLRFEESKDTLYSETDAKIKIELPKGSYRLEWINTKIGKIENPQNINHNGGEIELSSPIFIEDTALRILRLKIED
ncbi:MAG: hypothetical protein AAB116_19085 [Candidatus Poribacteria bacterium]